ncbi:hypothetical protein BM1_02996 [Bipolaris maydis]|nr:hypothetical protein BM1_02996 [Bipolaris maydis]
MPQHYHISRGPLGYTTEKKCHMTILRGHTQFVIEVEIVRVKGTKLGEKLLQQLELWKVGTWSRSNDNLLFDPIYQHCLSLIEKLAPQTLLQDLSLQGLLHWPIYNLELVHEGVDGDICIKGEDECLYTPAFFTSPMRTADLPELCRDVPSFQARNIWIAPIVDEGKTLDSIQGRVVMAEGVPLYFKPRVEMREPDFERELCTLWRIYKAGLTTRFRVPRLHGIVVSGETTIGLLMTLVTSSEIGTHLRSPGLQERHELHRKWEEQLTAIIQGLHAHDIVWGDVHPMNVVIDEGMNAWAVDFGGMNNVEFVDDDKRETTEGDWQGITRIFKEWLPNLQRQS